jgi:hypothetical protein
MTATATQIRDVTAPGMDAAESLDQADCYIGIIQGVPEGDVLCDFLQAVGRGLPVVLVTPLRNPAPRWVREQAEVLLVLVPGAMVGPAAEIAMRAARCLLTERPDLAKRRRN